MSGNPGADEEQAVDEVHRAMEMYHPVSHSGVSEEQWQELVSLEIFVVVFLVVAMVVCEWQETHASLTYDAGFRKDGRHNMNPVCFSASASECNVGNSTSPFTVSPPGRQRRVSLLPEIRYNA